MSAVPITVVFFLLLAAMHDLASATIATVCFGPSAHWHRTA
jgi:hypothetical protein